MAVSIGLRKGMLEHVAEAVTPGARCSLKNSQIAESSVRREREPVASLTARLLKSWLQKCIILALEKKVGIHTLSSLRPFCIVATADCTLSVMGNHNTPIWGNRGVSLSWSYPVYSFENIFLTDFLVVCLLF